MIPPFNADGLLAPGKHDCTLEEIERGLSFSDRRVQILRGLKEMLKNMPFKSAIEYILVDGSFVESKTAPGDVDIVLVVGEIRDAWPSSDLLHWVAVHHATLKSTFHCDTYVADEARVAEYWDSRFGLTRRKQPKGMLRVRFPQGDAS